MFSDSRLIKFKDKYKNHRCFIVGSGPSIANTDLTKLNDEYICVSSFFPFHVNYKNFKHVFHMQSASVSWFSGRLCDVMYYLNISNDKAIRFWDSSFISVNRKYKYFDEKSIYYISSMPYPEGAVPPHIEFDPTKIYWIYGTVIMDLMLPLAYYMGFDEFYLVGCDTNLHLDEYPDWTHSHFYDYRLTPLWLRGHQQRGETKGIRPHQLDAQYKLFKDTFESNNKIICDATIGGSLDVFDKVEYDSLFE